MSGVVDLTQDDEDGNTEKVVSTRSTPGIKTLSMRTTQSAVSGESVDDENSGYNKENRTSSLTSEEEEDDDEDEDDVQTGAQIFRNQRKRLRSSCGTMKNQEEQTLIQGGSNHVDDVQSDYRGGEKDTSQRRQKCLRNGKRAHQEIGSVANDNEMALNVNHRETKSYSSSRPKRRPKSSRPTSALSLEKIPATDGHDEGDGEEPQSCGQGKRSSSTSLRKNSKFSAKRLKNGGSATPSPLRLLASPTLPDELCVRPKKLREIQTWFENAVNDSVRSGRPSLLFLVGPPGVGKSTTVEVLSKYLGVQWMEWNDNGSRGGWATEHSPELRFDYVSVLSSFQSFLSAASQFPALNTADSEQTPLEYSGSTPHLLLLHDIPRANNSSVEAREYVKRQVDDALRKYLTYGKYPLIVILSSGDQDEDSPSANTVTKLVSSEVADHSRTRTIEVRPVTNARMKSVLTGLLEGNQRTHRRKPDSQISELIDHAVQVANGDLRHAISTLSFWIRGEHMQGASRPLACGRDRFIGMLHSLGKLLYAKRNENGQLENDHEQIAADSGLDPAALASFMHENCAEMFSSVDSLSRTIDSLCISDVIQTSKYRSGLSGRKTSSLRGCEDSSYVSATHSTGQISFPDSYANCISSRAISSYNYSPVPTGFKKLSKPSAFEMERNRRSNYRWISLGGLGWLHGLRSRWAQGTITVDRQSVEVKEPRYCFDTPHSQCLWKIPYFYRLLSHQRSRVYGISDAERRLLQAACSYGRVTEGKTSLWDHGLNLSDCAPVHDTLDDNPEEIED